MGFGSAMTASLGKVNSETNLAVQLLLAVSDGGRGMRNSTHKAATTTNRNVETAQSSSSDANRESNGSLSEMKSDCSDSPEPHGKFECAGGAVRQVPRNTSKLADKQGASNTDAQRREWTSVSKGREMAAVNIKSSMVPTSATKTAVANITIGSGYPVSGRGMTTPMFKYSRQERQEALQRFREKKQRRQFQKRVRYHVRKRLAEARPRYKGRFSKPSADESSDDGLVLSTPGSDSTSPSTGTNMTPVQKSSTRPESVSGDATGGTEVTRKTVAVSN